MNLDYVKIPFTNNPSMTRYDGPIYNKTPNKNYLSEKAKQMEYFGNSIYGCLLYTSPSPRDKRQSRMPSSA